LLVAAKIRQEVLISILDKEQKSQAENVCGLIIESLNLSRSLTTELSPPILRSGDLSASLEWLARWMYEKHGLEVKIQTKARIVLDRKDLTVLLFQSIRELLLNVLKHAGVSSARITIVRDEDDWLRIVVSDQGVGFDPAGIWQKAQTAQGFGLFSVRERMMLMGGQLEVESTPGMETSFSLVVPLENTKASCKGLPVLDPDKKPSAASSAAPDPLQATGNKIRVILVDDHVLMRQGLFTMLSYHSDIEVVGEASDGEKAVHLTRKIVPDVILMDISMPKMNGLEATRIIHSEFPRIRIIALSMYDEDYLVAKMISAGASAYRSKSDNTDLLLAAIRGEVE